jgi:hypothetical protein
VQTGVGIGERVRPWGEAADARTWGRRYTPAEQRRRRVRIAIHASCANTTDWTAPTSPGTKAFLDRFERSVGPDGVLPEEIRAAMAKHARTAYMLYLAEESAAAWRRLAQPQIP